MTPTPETTADVIEVITETLGLDDDRAGALDASSPLLDAIPELDSMAIVQIVTGLEDRYDIEVDGDDITGEVFETVGSLAAFMDTQR